MRAGEVARATLARLTGKSLSMVALHDRYPSILTRPPPDALSHVVLIDATWSSYSKCGAVPCRGNSIV